MPRVSTRAALALLAYPIGAGIVIGVVVDRLILWLVG